MQEHVVRRLTVGIYFHIPFCKQACHYCDFHFVTSLKQKEEMLAAMEQELLWQSQQSFFNSSVKIQTIYFGGGTPSLLNGEEIRRLMDCCAKYFNLSELNEVTLEANPDDLQGSKIQDFQKAGINRLSIGVQSFFEEDLRWMNRAHGAGEAELAIKTAQDAGLINITADLIYGYPLLTDEKWEENIRTMVKLGVPHISAYSMTVEPKTALGAWVKRGKEPAMDEEQSARQFERLMEILDESGFLHYEISNWAKPGYLAVHNSNYWKGVPYLGIGPSAHGFNGQKRYWNVPNNARYMNHLQESGEPLFEEELLSPTDHYNEYIMTSLRTIWGVDLDYVKATFPNSHSEALEKDLNRLESQGLVKRMSCENNISEPGLESKATAYVLTQSGKLIADRIASDLFFA